MNPFVITKKTSGFCRKFYNEVESRLLESAVLGRLDHLLVGGDVDLDTAVLSPSFLGAVVSDRHGIRLALSGHAGSGDTAVLQVVGDALSPLVGKPLVDSVGTSVVRVTVDCDVSVLHVRHLAGEVAELVLGSLLEVGLVGVEENTAVEGDLDGLESIGVLDSLDLGVLKGGEFLGLLVHLLSDDSSGSGTDGCSDGGADGGTLAILTDDSAKSGTDSGTSA